MRSDMFKCIVESARRGGSTSQIYKRAKRRKLNNPDNWENISIKDSMSGHRNFGYECKELSETLNPLERFLESKVGELWDDIYSETRENLNPNNAVQYHVIQHLEWMVEKNVVINEDGDPCYIGYKFGFSQLSSGSLYVDPNTNRLTKVPEKRNKPKDEKSKFMNYSYGFFKKTPALCFIQDNMFYFKSKGLWYSAVIGNGYNYDSSQVDLLEGIFLSRERSKYIYGGEGKYLLANSKKQLSKKELMKLEIKND